MTWNGPSASALETRLSHSAFLRVELVDRAATMPSVGSSTALPQLQTQSATSPSQARTWRLPIPMGVRGKLGQI